MEQPKLEGTFDFVPSYITITEEDEKGNTYMVIDGVAKIPEGTPGKPEGGDHYVNINWMIHGTAAKFSVVKNGMTVNKRMIEIARDNYRGIMKREPNSKEFDQLHLFSGCQIRIYWSRDKIDDNGRTWPSQMQYGAPYKRKPIADKGALEDRFFELFGHPKDTLAEDDSFDPDTFEEPAYMKEQV